MPVLFVSHSSKDDAAAAVLAAWLRHRGLTDVFVDHSNIAGGEKWAQALRDAAGACRVVICLVTERWLFCGRSREIAETLEELRQVRAVGTLGRS
jgi:TIR domain-containing protein